MSLNKLLDETDLEYEIVDDEQNDDEFNNSLNELYLYIKNLKHQMYYTNEEFSYIYETFEYILTKFLTINNNKYLIIAMKFIIYTRDIQGLQQSFASFILLDVLSNHDLNSAYFILEKFLTVVGSWKDIKKIYDYYRDYKYTTSSPLILQSIVLSNEQLKKDLIESDKLSLVSKWIPREKTKYKKLYTQMACHYFQEYFPTDNHIEACKKAKTNYRKIIASLNKKLDTVQIKQCSKQWAKIDPEKQTYLALKRQQNAFLNLTSEGQEKYETSDRIICGYNFASYYEELKDNFDNNHNNLPFAQFDIDIFTSLYPFMDE